ncbi:hypothetical protein [Sphingomonas mali]|uniref:hypothetical protein n=1 Tax=Sphingomonas mali TaxID=40682 RepID=UPI0012ED7A5C|nr:hypothetical protein [Sphingomonas mali]
MIALVLVVMSGVMIGLFAFGVSGKGAQSAAPAGASPDANVSASVAPSAPSPSTPAPEPMAPVQYDDPAASGAPSATPTTDSPTRRPALF